MQPLIESESSRSPLPSFSGFGFQHNLFGNGVCALLLLNVENISFWDGLPNLYELAKEISPDDTKFQYLDAAQLIKHILGLKNSCDKYNFQIKPGLNGRRLFTRSFRLLYLWYDVLGKDGVEHRKEIEQFAEIAQRDNIKFSHITYQEVIMKLSKEFYEGNEDYLNYITDRYL